jgi:hypothetical protein
LELGQGGLLLGVASFGDGFVDFPADSAEEVLVAAATGLSSSSAQPLQFR